MKVVRVFEFPRESVFRMWVDPSKLGQWWGPEGSATILSEVDPRQGGRIRVDQRNPDGVVYSFNATFEKFVPPELLVYRSRSPGAAGFSPWESVNTVTFEELGPRRTRMTAVTEVVAGPQEERESLKEAYRAGWGQSLEKLQRALR